MTVREQHASASSRSYVVWSSDTPSDRRARRARRSWVAALAGRRRRLARRAGRSAGRSTMPQAVSEQTPLPPEGCLIGSAARSVILVCWSAPVDLLAQEPAA